MRIKGCIELDFLGNQGSLVARTPCSIVITKQRDEQLTAQDY